MDKVQALWSAVRYIFVAIGAFLVALNWADSDSISALLSNLDAVIGGLAAVVAAVFGIYKRATGA